MSHDESLILIHSVRDPDSCHQVVLLKPEPGTSLHSSWNKHQLEGEDKPYKYPTIFDGAHLALITKTDLSEVLEVDLNALRGAIQDVAPGARQIELSSRSGEG